MSSCFAIEVDVENILDQGDIDHLHNQCSIFVGNNAKDKIKISLHIKNGEMKAFKLPPGCPYGIRFTKGDPSLPGLIFDKAQNSTDQFILIFDNSKGTEYILLHFGEDSLVYDYLNPNSARVKTLVGQ